MPNSEELKQIVCEFLQCSPEEIHNETLINREALKNSIKVHRMYGILASKGYAIENYYSINTFGELLLALDNTETDLPQKMIYSTVEISKDNAEVGIDIEQIENFPIVSDYRTDKFYIQNFTEHEIAYCILKSDPRASFAGLFAA